MESRERRTGSKSGRDIRCLRPAQVVSTINMFSWYEQIYKRQGTNHHLSLCTISKPSTVSKEQDVCHLRTIRMQDDHRVMRVGRKPLNTRSSIIMFILHKGYSTSFLFVASIAGVYNLLRNLVVKYKWFISLLL